MGFSLQYLKTKYFIHCWKKEFQTLNLNYLVQVKKVRKVEKNLSRGVQKGGVYTYQHPLLTLDNGLHNLDTYPKIVKGTPRGKYPPTSLALKIHPSYYLYYTPLEFGLKGV